MSSRILFGALAVLFTAIIGAQAVGEKGEFPLLRRLFDGDALLVNHVIYVVASIGGALSAYLAANAGPAEKVN